ncbi:hypothetical protein SmJEL517_g06092 [Synchytrium microbalum]|uniref:Uncharacterized protein n=1 Tax=Synchytrium microbalum TaxID=1806994 RepID=A0A507BYH3_9FUNG|nr:uncharacterized protein SmJEL517_g06092 [Synchytrium microbalum]TPX30323.1 hypothetical protein SmJEL517_g06092 [Synchytrium microbalum]
MLSQSGLPNLPGKDSKTTTQTVNPTPGLNEPYSFSAEPRPVQNNQQQIQRKKYRDVAVALPPAAEKDQRLAPVNIMHDRRIHRGSTYAAPIGALNSQPDPVELERQAEMKRRLKARRRAEAQRRPKTPDAVEGRRHIEVQTDVYLEELSDKVPESDAAAQTDAFLDRPPSPLYIPQKSGMDASTQILEGELFDFDIEVGPILQVLVGKTLEQSLMEVAEEDELESLRKHQSEYETRRAAELAETQRLEEAERRRTEEKQRRLQERERVAELQHQAAARVAARAFASSYLKDLVPSVFETLTQRGFYGDPVQKEVESTFLPWLTGQVESSLDRYKTAQQVVDALLLQAIRELRQ